MGGITIIGLGPGEFGHITLEALKLLESGRPVLVRTQKHPAVSGLAERKIAFESCDHYYEKLPSFEAVYDAIARECVERGRREKIVYAVPGSPTVAEKSVVIIRRLAEAAGVPVTVLPGMSFLELLFCRLAVDPVDGVTVVDAADIAKLPPDSGTGLVVTQVYNRQVASEAKLSLMEQYPDDYPVIFARNLGLPDEEVRTIPLYELDRQPVIDHLTSVYAPRPQARLQTFSLQPITDIMARLRSPGGCVWDIEQTHESLRRYMVEEVYEVLEAIELADADKLCEELGDLLLQVVFHARIAEECGRFSMQDVVDTVAEKMIRRHPHVFGDITVRDAAEVVVNWEKIKSREKTDRHSVLDGVPKGLPSLMRAYKLQGKAAKVGFDWNSIGPVWDKLYEELGELRQALAGQDPAAVRDELGDVLFTVVNLSRFLGIEPETALNTVNHKFIKRFAYVENQVEKRGVAWSEYSLDELDALWVEAKHQKCKENQ